MRLQMRSRAAVRIRVRTRDAAAGSRDRVWPRVCGVARTEMPWTLRPCGRARCDRHSTQSTCVESETVPGPRPACALPWPRRGCARCDGGASRASSTGPYAGTGAKRET